ncbi:thiamine phosphate synthase [Anaplasma capra]|uniref:thiamine phosphate synthase n=1 Tax=Anaplasma capra TaxID=1562740 RepID=UPI0021D5AECF|nr:thiamine phosphate synthase [Anaplasma capra]MCU7611372.1 thiamine phosphate synthase [Anaplasma capra]MCU7612446.1 thiamine phosphate synthase [Anaplasma capra]
MHLIDGADSAHGVMAEVVRDAHLRMKTGVYVVNAECKSCGVYADYYFDGVEEIKLLYRCATVTDSGTFANSYNYVADVVSSTTKCRDAGDIQLDCVVLARTLTSFVLSGGLLSEWSLNCATSEYLPVIVNGFCSQDAKTSFGKMEKVGLYPIVPDDYWFERVMRCGVKTIQLRSKGAPMGAVEKMIERCAKLSADNWVRLIVNDYWDLAIKHGAYGVHLGQEDIKTADFDKMLKSGIRLGISTHCYHELARASFFCPSYVALGPVFHTTSKDMRFNPQGLELLKQWVQCAKFPVVGIGGINVSNVSSVVDCGVRGVAVVSAITEAEDPESVVRHLKQATADCAA